MVRNIEALAEYGELRIRETLRLSLNKIESFLNYLSKLENPTKSDINELKGLDLNFDHPFEVFKAVYGVEFPDIERDYNKMLPEIKKYLDVKE